MDTDIGTAIDKWIVEEELPRKSLENGVIPTHLA